MWNSLPKFLLCDQNTGTNKVRMFVMHCHAPRFLMEFIPDGDGEVFLIDSEPKPDELEEARDGARDFFEDAMG